MAAWDYTNDYSATLTAGYTAGGGTLAVSTVTGLPASGRKFILKVGNEYFLCTSYTGLNLTVTGAQSGSSASNHSSGDSITGCWIIPSVLDGLRSDANQIGTYANLPTSGMKKGDQYHCTDSAYHFIYDGSAWQAWYQGYPVILPPTVGSLTWVNQGIATGDNNGGTLAISTTASSGASVHILKKAAPATPWTFIVGMLLNCRIGNFVHSGAIIRDSGTGKLIQYGPGTASGIAINLDYWNSPTSFSTAASEVTWDPSVIFYKITDDGTNHTYYLSDDGIHWQQFFQASRTTFLANPNEIGVSIDPENFAATLTIFHWSN